MKSEKISTYRVIGSIVLCLACLSVAQIVQFYLQEFLNGIPGFYGGGNIISGFVYIGMVYLVLKLICTKVLQMSIKSCRIGKITIKLKWIIVAGILPLTVLGVLSLLQGECIINRVLGENCFYNITLLIFVYGLGGGIVEEMIFRGVMMTTVEMRYGKKCAILLPSVIFAMGHIGPETKDFISILMILIAGVSVGCMFSFIVYDSGSIWNSAIVHIVWNAIILGAEHNIEASGVAILGYWMVSLAAVYCIKIKTNSKRENN